MEELLKSDIFFFITSVSVVAVTVLIIIVLVYIAEILRDIRHVSKNVRKESDHFTEIVNEILKDFHKGTKKVTGVVAKIFTSKKRRNSKK